MTIAFDSESITVSSSAVTFTASKIKPESGAKKQAIEATFVCETDQIRYTVDGTTPTTTVGLLVEAGDVITISGEHDVENFQAIRVTGDATIQPTYFAGY